jgi:hypothetical protein
MENAFPNVWLKFIHETNPSFPEHCQPNSCILVTHKATAELLTSTCTKLLVAPLKTTTTKNNCFLTVTCERRCLFEKNASELLRILVEHGLLLLLPGICLRSGPLDDGVGL